MYKKKLIQKEHCVFFEFYLRFAKLAKIYLITSISLALKKCSLQRKVPL